MNYWDIVERTQKILGEEQKERATSKKLVGPYSSVDLTEDQLDEDGIVERIKQATSGFLDKFFQGHNSEDVTRIMVQDPDDWAEKINSYMPSHGLNSIGALRSIWFNITGEKDPV